MPHRIPRAQCAGISTTGIDSALVSVTRAFIPFSRAFGWFAPPTSTRSLEPTKLWNQFALTDRVVNVFVSMTLVIRVCYERRHGAQTGHCARAPKGAFSMTSQSAALQNGRHCVCRCNFAYVSGGDGHGETGRRRSARARDCRPRFK